MALRAGGRALTTLLFWQHTALVEHDPSPTPMTLTGEQLMPTRTSALWMTTPSRLRRAAVEGLVACGKDKSYSVMRHVGPGRATHILNRVAALDGAGGTAPWLRTRLAAAACGHGANRGRPRPWVGGRKDGEGEERGSNADAHLRLAGGEDGGEVGLAFGLLEGCWLRGAGSEESRGLFRTALIRRPLRCRQLTAPAGCWVERSSSRGRWVAAYETWDVDLEF